MGWSQGGRGQNGWSCRCSRTVRPPQTVLVEGEEAGGSCSSGGSGNLD